MGFSEDFSFFIHFIDQYCYMLFQRQVKYTIKLAGFWVAFDFHNFISYLNPGVFRNISLPDDISLLINF